MKIKSITLLLALTFPGLALADLVDFGTITKPNKGGGFRVTGVFQGTPAATLGITEGDVITKLDGSRLQPTAPLARLIAGVREADSEITVDWTRGGENMAGTAKLSSTLSKEAFDERYPNKLKSNSILRTTPMVVGGNLDDLDQDLEDLGLDVEKLQKQIEDALAGSGIGPLMSSASTSFRVMRVAQSPNGSKITVSGTGKEYGVKIESKDGEIIFDDKITKEQLDKVPAEEREFVKGLMGNGMNVIIRNSGINRGSGTKVEDSVSDLLKKAEEESKKDE